MEECTRGSPPLMHRPSTLDLRNFLSGVWILVFWSCAAAVLVLALIPVPESMPGTGWDISNHGLASSVLAILGFRAYPRHLAAVIVGLFCYGMLIEGLQSFLPYRFAEWEDVLADGSGIALGCVLEALYRKVGATLT